MTYRFSQPEGEAVNMQSGGSAGQFDPSESFLREAYSHPQQSCMVRATEPVIIDGQSGDSGWFHRPDNGSGHGRVHVESSQTRAVEKQLAQVFGELSSGDLATMIERLPNNEMDAVIGALPSKDQARYFEKLATIDMIDIKGAERAALASLPKEDLAKALGEVLADPARFQPKACPGKIHLLPPLLID